MNVETRSSNRRRPNRKLLILQVGFGSEITPHLRKHNCYISFLLHLFIVSYSFGVELFFVCLLCCIMGRYGVEEMNVSGKRICKFASIDRMAIMGTIFPH